MPDNIETVEDFGRSFDEAYESVRPENPPTTSWSRGIEGDDRHVNFSSGMYIHGPYGFSIIGIHQPEFMVNDKVVLEAAITHALAHGNEIAFHFEPVFFRRPRGNSTDEIRQVDFNIWGASYVFQSSFAQALRENVPARELSQLKDELVAWVNPDSTVEEPADFDLFQAAVAKMEGMEEVYTVLGKFDAQKDSFMDLADIQVVNPKFQ